MSLSELRNKIENKQAKLAVIGLGYVGLPVACVFGKAGFDVLGIELQADRIRKINNGISPIEGNEPGLDLLLSEVTSSKKIRATSSYQELNDRDVILICVETPVDENKIPQYKALKSALYSLGPVLKYGALVIVESTIAPGTMRDVVLPILEERNAHRLNEGFYLGNCPERVTPGRLLQHLYTIDRVVGGMTPETAETMLALYRHIVHADLDPADCMTAEIVKTAENAYRDVQIAFANEVALICEAVGVDVIKVRELVNKSPTRQMHLAGAGVGGHCIPKDPWLLAYGVKDMGVALHVIPAARAVNDFMPVHMVQLLEKALISVGKEISGARILVMGYAYLEDSDDIRNSPSEVLVTGLVAKGAEVIIHDPWVPAYQGDLLERVKGCDGVVVMVAHKAYKTLDIATLKTGIKLPVLIDGRRVYSKDQAQAAGFIYRAVGLAVQSS